MLKTRGFLETSDHATAAQIDAWYRDVVAKTLCRMQRHAAGSFWYVSVSGVAVAALGASQIWPFNLFWRMRTRPVLDDHDEAGNFVRDSWDSPWFPQFGGGLGTPVHTENEQLQHSLASDGQFSRDRETAESEVVITVLLQFRIGLCPQLCDVPILIFMLVLTLISNPTMFVIAAWLSASPLFLTTRRGISRVVDQ